EIGRLYRSAAAWPSSLAEEEGKRRIFRDGIGFCREALELSRRMGVIDEAARLRQVEALNRWNGEMPIRRWKELAVNGKDLIDAAGRPAGPWVGRTLRILADAVILGRLPNDHQLLIEEGV